MELGDATLSCPHADECPGCPLIDLPYGEQLSRKRGRVLREIGRYHETACVEVGAPVGAEPVVSYRERAKLAVDGTRIGLFARGSHRVVNTPECRVIDRAVAKVVEGVRTALPFDAPLRALDVRRTDEGLLAVLVFPEGTEPEIARAAAERIGRVVPELIGVAVSHRSERAPQVLGKMPTPLLGRAEARCYVRADGPFHFATHGAFTQAHRGQERALLGAIVDIVLARQKRAKTLSVLELFCGTGSLALELSSRGARVHAVEAFEPAARLAQRAADAQGLPVEVEAGDAGVLLADLVRKGRQFDAVIVNPPRRGLAPSLRADLARLQPRLLVYVSCEPATLARDLADLARRGLAPDAFVPYDMMPQTEEVETLALATPELPAGPEVLFRDQRLLAVAKAPHEPTTPQGEHDGSLLDRIRRLGGAEHATPVHRLDVGTSGVCLFALRPEYVSELSRALSEGAKEYVALARGVVRDKGSIRRPLLERGKPREARTRYARTEIVGGHSLVTVRPDEGRKHQIRRHLGAIGHAVVGDERYGHAPTNQHFSARYFLDRPFLHCARIGIVHDGRPLDLSARLAPDLESVLERLRGETLTWAGAPRGP